jgi:hypothetical protein
MPLSGQQVCDEVAWRIQNRIAANSSGAGSIINFANDALGLISSAASWTWDQTTAGGVTPGSGTGFLPTGNTPTLDPGKKIACFNSNTLTAIVKVTQDDYEAVAAGYANVTGIEYNAFRLWTDSSFNGYAVGLAFYPPLGPGQTVDVFYHLLPPVLVYGGSPTVRWTMPEMDALLKDWTTAIAMKWLSMSGWDTTWADCLGRVGEFRRKFTTERINTGPEDEAKGEVSEANTVGRA